MVINKLLTYYLKNKLLTSNTSISLLLAWPRACTINQEHLWSSISVPIYNREEHMDIFVMSKNNFPVIFWPLFYLPYCIRICKAIQVIILENVGNCQRKCKLATSVIFYKNWHACAWKYMPISISTSLSPLKFSSFAPYNSNVQAT